MFQRADVVVGSHGAGLGHMMWMPRGATVVEMIPNAAVSMVYKELALVFGLKYLPVRNFAPVADIVEQIVLGQRCTKAHSNNTAGAVSECH